LGLDSKVGKQFVKTLDRESLGLLVTRRYSRKW